MADKEPDWISLSLQEDKPTEVLPGHHWEKNKAGNWSQVEDGVDTSTAGSKIPDDLSYLKNIQIKKAPASPVFDYDTPVSSASAESVTTDADDSSTPAKRLAKMPTRPGQQPIVTPAMIKAAGAADLREYLNMQKGLIDRRAASVVNKKAGVVPEDFSPQKLYPKVGPPKKYAKGGKISLDACGVSTHKPSKKNANW